jgi:hypothetical protein
MNGRNIGVMYSWRLPAGDGGTARRIVEQLRDRARKLGLEPVSQLVVLAGEEAEKDQRLPRRYEWTPGAGEKPLQAIEAVFFTATLPGGDRAAFGLGKYQEDANPGWSWEGVYRTYDLRTLGEFSVAAAELGLEVRESFAGMVFTHRKDENGEVKTDQQEAIPFDPETF